MFREHRHTLRPGLRLGVISGGVAVALTGCSAETLKVGYLPTERGLTDKVDPIINLWNASWIASMAVALIVWGLIIVAAILFRRRHDNEPLPPQTKYNVPLEVVYTLVPLLMIGVFFVHNDRAVANTERRSDNPDVKIQAIGKQWAWDFNYTDEGVYESTTQLDLDVARPLEEDEMPTLYLPVNKTVEITLDARDVIHSFWVPAFLYKKDMIPGHTNYWTFKPQVTGTYAGKCAELCGQYHSAMIFQVKVVTQEEYDQQMQKLRDKGQVGKLGNELNRKSPAELSRMEG